MDGKDEKVRAPSLWRCTRPPDGTTHDDTKAASRDSCPLRQLAPNSSGWLVGLWTVRSRFIDIWGRVSRKRSTNEPYAWSLIHARSRSSAKGDRCDLSRVADSESTTKGTLTMRFFTHPYHRMSKESRRQWH